MLNAERERVYQKEYYQKNRERLLEYRKNKYRSSPEYRETIRKGAERYRLTHPRKPSSLYFDVIHDSFTEHTYPMSAVKYRDTQTIWGLKKRGVIPRFIYLTKSKKPCLSESQVKLLDYVFRLADSVCLLTYEDARTIFHEFWTKRFNSKEVSWRVKAIREAREQDRIRESSQRRKGYGVQIREYGYKEEGKDKERRASLC